MPKSVMLPIESFRTDPDALEKFEARHGKIGAVALLGALLQASIYLKRPLPGLEKHAMSNAVAVDVAEPTTLKDGFHMLQVGGSAGGDAANGIDSLNIRNGGRRRVALILEGKDEKGRSYGFGYHQMEPATQVTVGYGRARMVFAVVMGSGRTGVHTTVTPATIAQGRRDCHLERNWFVRNVCVGTPFCAAGQTCDWDTAGPFWLFWEEDPTHCVCQ
jgi:hypothetical protein